MTAAINHQQLGQRIANALSKKVPAADVAQLIRDVESAIGEATVAAAQARDRALDPLEIPDPVKARGSVEIAEFALQRLQAVLPRLDQRLQILEANEYSQQWDKDFETVEATVAAEAVRFATIKSLIDQIVKLLQAAAAIDAEVKRLNARKPQGEHRHLRGPELTARDLREFTRDNPSIADRIQLPDWSHSSLNVWPEPRPPLSVEFAAQFSGVVDPRYTADWAEAAAHDNARRAELADQRVAEEAKAEVASCEAYEASLRR